MLVDAKCEGRFRVVCHANRADDRPRREFQCIAIGIGSCQTGPLQWVNGAGRATELVELFRVGVERDSSAAQVGQCIVLPVVAVRVSEKHGIHAVPRRADLSESRAQDLRGKPAINQ